MKDRKSLSPQNKLANVCDSLADDVFDGHIEADKKTSKRAAQISRNSLEQAVSSANASDSIPVAPGREWTKRMDKKPSPKKGKY